mmetsp:Transcript_32805/g.69864  ORF Transcript_32805/g.69864 Transcript_32805/m.69864 type:complete len:267 (+) Transcript_32805:2-802(+)
MSNGAKARAGAVLVATTAGVVTWLIPFVASVTMAASAAAVTTLGVAGGVCILIVPLVWISEGRLAHLTALRKRMNHLNQEAERFKKVVASLRMEERDLMEQEETLARSNEELEQIVKEHNTGNVYEMVDMVQENQLLLRRMKENLRQVVIQDVVRLVLKCDLDRDNSLSRREAGILETRLSYSLQIYGIVFDANKFRRAVGLSPSLCGVMTIVKRLLPDEHGRLSSFYDDDDGDEEEEEEYATEGAADDGLYDMFYLTIHGSTTTL